MALFPSDIPLPNPSPASGRGAHCEIAAVVLAAGASRRFGSDKLLHPVRRHGATLPLAAHSLLPWLETFGQVTVVVRPTAEAFCSEIETALGATRAAAIRWVRCADAAQGMAASLACGVRANRDAAGWLIGLADMPAVPEMAIAGVRDALREGAALAAPFRDGRRGHPAGFSARYREDLLGLKGDAGARALLERDRSRVTQVKIGSDGIFADIDTPDDLELL
ncbi:MAG TPA: nucleotidyltransferase family protein [Gallionella sp.]|nr:nucleotidyltransferase family protein [Gallionella sp.]